jgi:salicylate hydroxylase
MMLWLRSCSRGPRIVGGVRALHFNDASPAQRVVIVGGGIGGAALAVALHNRGIPYRLYEKDAHAAVRKQGYALTLQQGMSIMKWLGFDRDKDMVSHGAISNLHASFAKDGSSLGAYGPPPVAERKSGRDKGKHNLHIPRTALRDVLFGALDPDNIVWGHEIEDYTERKVFMGGVNQPSHSIIAATFSNGVKVECGLLVGADGIYSRVRSLMYSKAQSDPNLWSLMQARGTAESRDYAPKGDNLHFLDLMVILGIAPEPNCHTQKQWVDGQTRCFTMPYNTSHRMWQLSFPSSEVAAIRHTGDCVALKSLALKQCAGWAPELTTLMRATEVLSGHPVYDRDPIPPVSVTMTMADNHKYNKNENKKNNNNNGEGCGSAVGHNTFRSCVTLLGDSVHPMSPFKGQGANQCLLSVYDLARSLSGSTLSQRHKREKGETCSTKSKSKSKIQAKLTTGSKQAEEHGCSGKDEGYANRARSMHVEYGRHPVESVLESYETSMLARSGAKVLKSREAARVLHSPGVLQHANSNRAAVAAAATTL